MKELFEELLGPEAANILADAAQQRDVIAPHELEAALLYQTGAPLGEDHKRSLNDLVSALADNFSTRRRAIELRRLMVVTQPETDEDDWLPEDDSGYGEGPDGTVGSTMGSLLSDLREEDPVADEFGDDELP